MRRAAALGSLLACLAAAAGAQTAAKRGLTIKAPAEGDYLIRVKPAQGAPGPEPLPSRFTDPTTNVSIDTKAVGQKPMVMVDDVKSGNTAVRTVDLSSADGLITLRSSDFDHVRQVDVKVTYDSKAVRVARVTLTSAGAKPTSVTLDPTRAGVATFEDVAVGRAQVTVMAGEGVKSTLDAEITTDHTGARLTINAPLGSKVPTLEAGAASTAPEGPAMTAPGGAAGAPAQPASGGFTSLVSTLLGLAVIGGIGYALYRWTQSGGMAATLKKAGIEVSGAPPPDASGTPWQQSAPPPPVVADPTRCQFCGETKGPDGACACSVGAVPAGAPAPGPTHPRLVGVAGIYSGRIFELGGSELTFGRSPDCTAALVDDTTVSRRHATLRADSGGASITDEGSSNGVYVNGVRIAGSQALRPGDEVQIGATQFRLEL
jgi:hypothetical protein